MDSAAITDHGVMYGVIDFYKAARESGINPILGCEVYVAPGSRFDRRWYMERTDIIIWCCWQRIITGYSNLMKIVSKALWRDIIISRVWIWKLLEKYHEGIIALSACLAGEVQRNLARGMYEDAKEAALRYAGMFWKRQFLSGAAGSWNSGAEAGKPAASAHESGDRN